MRNLHTLPSLFLLCALTAPAHAQPGTLDPTFGTGGTVTLQLGGQATNVFAMATTADGEVVVAGQTGTPLFPFVMRFLMNGTPDPAFGTNGAVVLTLPPGQTGEFRSVIVAPDGKILTAGSVGATGAGNIGTRDGLLARFTSTGALDNNFGTGGTAVTNLSNGMLGDIISAITLDGQGRIVACGEANLQPDNSFFTDLVVARFLANGDLDSGFGTGGRFFPDFASVQARGRAVAVRPNNMIVAAGIYTLAPGNESYVAIQLTENGVLSTGWATGGVREVSWGNQSDRLSAMALVGDGSLVLGGTAASPGAQGFGLAKINPSGAFDQGFGQFGTRYINPTGNLHYGGYVALQPDDRILLGGSGVYMGSTQDFMLLRRLPNGDPDPSFGTNGYFALDFLGGSNSMGALQLGADGKALIAGTATLAGQQHLALARVLTGLTTQVPESATSTIGVFPNPASDELCMTLSEKSAARTPPRVRDVMGREVELAAHAQAQGWMLDVRTLAPGRYFVSVTDAQGGASTTTFIKH